MTKSLDNKQPRVKNPRFSAKSLPAGKVGLFTASLQNMAKSTEFSQSLNKFLFLGILLFAFTLRVYGINWDQNQHLHPDERFLTMTTEKMLWPKTLAEYLSPSISKLNPYNIDAGFFVYGTLPTTSVKYFSAYKLFGNYQYNNITLTGRLISAILDTTVVILICLITTAIFNNKALSLLSSFVYSISVLPIQLSHFFAVDTFLNFFLILSFYFLIRLTSKNRWVNVILLGLSFGAALACKISALYFFPIICLGFLLFYLKTKRLVRVCGYFLLAVFSIIISFRILDPHTFTGNLFPPKVSPQFVQNIKELQSIASDNSFYPPAIQWLKTTPLLFPLKNIVIWGLGLPLGILFIVSIASEIYRLKSFYKLKPVENIRNILNGLTTNDFGRTLILIWILFLLVSQGFQFTPSMRYFLPIYPFMAIFVAKFSVEKIFPVFKNHILLFTTYFLLLLIWPLSFLSIYTRSHSRISASEWIYQNIPAGAALSCDLWDDCLPLPLDQTKKPQQYQTVTMQPFAVDSQQKISDFVNGLKQIDYLVLSSNRAWDSIPKLPEKYPFMAKFYDDLFSGKLEFEKVAEITSYPTIPVLNISIPDQPSEEAFTVYDHPKILIFKKVSKSFEE